MPDGTLEDLRRAAQRRDLEALELVVGAQQAHGVEASCGVKRDEEAAEDLQADDPPIRWLLMKQEPSVTEVLYWGRRASLLEAGLLLRGTVPESPLGLPVALVHSTDLKAAQQAAAWARLHDAQTCWEVDLEQHDSAQIEEVLDATAPTLAHVRLLGAGPEAESEASESGGTGTLFSKLALRGYTGTVALAPSSPDVLEEWQKWLFERRGWGCNTAAQKKAE